MRPQAFPPDLPSLLDSVVEAPATHTVLEAGARLAQALTETPDVAEAGREILHRLDSPADALARRSLVRALGCLPGSAVDRSLGEALFDDDPGVRLAAARAAEGRPPRPWLVPALLRVLADDGPGRAVAQGALERWAPLLEGALSPYLQLVLESSSEVGLRRAASELLEVRQAPSPAVAPERRAAGPFAGAARPILAVALGSGDGAGGRWPRLARSIAARRELAGSRVLLASPARRLAGEAQPGLERLALGPADPGDATGLSLRRALEAAIEERLAEEVPAALLVDVLNTAAWATLRVARRTGVPLLVLGDGRSPVRRVAALAPQRRSFAGLDERHGWLFRLEVAALLERQTAGGVVAPPGTEEGEIAARIASLVGGLAIAGRAWRRAS